MKHMKHTCNVKIERAVKRSSFTLFFSQNKVSFEHYVCFSKAILLENTPYILISIPSFIYSLSQMI